MTPASSHTESAIFSDVDGSAPWALWAIAFALVVSLHVGFAVFVASSALEAFDGAPDDTVNVELIPDPSDQKAPPSDVAGPTVVEPPAPTSEIAKAEDPDPPAPDSAALTQPKQKPLPTPELTAPPAPVVADAQLPPEQPTEMHLDKPPEAEPVEKTPDQKDEKVEQTNTPSQASSGSAALLSGGRRPSAAAKATWRGEVGTHLVQNRRYPTEARALGHQGIAEVKVTIDDKGHVLGEELIKSSGRKVLDGEALDLMHRADPFPAPPSGMPTPVTMVVPVNFSIR